ncbi:MAG: 3'-5' exonuclease [Woeseiaceae bacterium]
MPGVIALRVIAILLLLATQLANAQEFAWPNDDPDNWLLAFVDVETTGLIPGHHEMIDIGIVMTDLKGVELGELFLRILPEHPERTADGARAVNAFSAERWRELNALSKREAIDAMLAFHNSIAGDRNVLMVAFNSHFDTAFLDHLFRSQDSSWRELYHYFVLDIPSMAWSLGFHGLTGSSVSGMLGIEDEPHVAELHTGITGARLNARIYRGLLDRSNQETNND